CFFFQAEDGIRDRNVTGVQTCALPILWTARHVDEPYRRAGFDAELVGLERGDAGTVAGHLHFDHRASRLGGGRSGRHIGRRGCEIGRASCRERGGGWVGGVALEETTAR